MVEIDFDIVKVQLHDIDPKDFKSCAHLDKAPELSEDIIEKYSYKKLFNYGTIVQRRLFGDNEGYS